MRSIPSHQKKPDWLKIKLPSGAEAQAIAQSLKQGGLKTVCKESNCPNQGQCWNAKTATFMLLGDSCTRACRFCSVKTSANPAPPDPNEPESLCRAAQALGLKYLVLTTVDRDDLKDQGAGHMIRTIQTLKSNLPKVKIELLMPDFQGDLELVTKVAQAGADVLGHNLECVRSKTALVRDPRAGYDQSLAVLKQAAKAVPSVITKSSLMLGFGESLDEIRQSMRDLREVGCHFLTLGQYLTPAKGKLKVTSYVPPETFDSLAIEAKAMGFLSVASGPLVRSSYQAALFYETAIPASDHAAPTS